MATSSTSRKRGAQDDGNKDPVVLTPSSTHAHLVQHVAVALGLGDCTGTLVGLWRHETPTTAAAAAAAATDWCTKRAECAAMRTQLESAVKKAGMAVDKAWMVQQDKSHFCSKCGYCGLHCSCPPPLLNQHGYDYVLWSVRDAAIPAAQLLGAAVCINPHGKGDGRGVVTAVTGGEGTGSPLRCDVKLLSGGEKTGKRVKATQTEVRAMLRLDNTSGSSGSGSNGGSGAAGGGAGGGAGAGSSGTPRQVGRVIIVESTIDYRVAARSQTMPSDYVLELGSSYGECSQLLHRYAKEVIGVDVGAEVVRTARERYPDIHFEVLDVLRDVPSLLALRPKSNPKGGWDTVFVDLGGDRTLSALYPVLETVMKEVKPRLMVVKSEVLYASAAAWCAKHVAKEKLGVVPRMVPAPEQWLAHQATTKEKTKRPQQKKRVGSALG